MLIGTVAVAVTVNANKGSFSRSKGSAIEPQEGHWGAVVRGRMFLQQNRPDLALQAVALVRDERPGAGEAMGVAGVALARMEKIRSARSALERAIALQPKQPIVVKTLAAIYLSLGETDRGLDLLKKATMLTPSDPHPWFAMGKVYLDMGLTADAASAFEESLKRDPSQPEARLGRIEALLASGRAEDAGPLVTEALRIEPDNPQLLGLAARQARDSGRPDEAISFAERALKLDPEVIEALMTRARLCHASGRDEIALADVERVVSKNPNLLSALNLKMQIQTSLGLTKGVSETAVLLKKQTERLALMEELTKEIGRRPDDAKPRWRLGQVAAEGGQIVLAANCYQAALALDPNCRPAAEGLTALNAVKGPGNPPEERPAVSPLLMPGRIE